MWCNRAPGGARICVPPRILTRILLYTPNVSAQKRYQEMLNSHSRVFLVSENYLLAVAVVEIFVVFFAWVAHVFLHPLVEWRSLFQPSPDRLYLSGELRMLRSEFYILHPINSIRYPELKPTLSKILGLLFELQSKSLSIPRIAMASFPKYQ